MLSVTHLQSYAMPTLSVTLICYTGVSLFTCCAVCTDLINRVVGFSSVQTSSGGQAPGKLFYALSFPLIPFPYRMLAT